MVCDSENEKALKMLKERITRQQNELYRQINEYAEKYLSYLYDVLHSCKMSGYVMRKRDKVAGRIKIEKNDKFAFYEPYIYRFYPDAWNTESERIYHVDNILKDYEKIR